MALHLLKPFINPTIPFSSPIQGGLKDGMVITVCGRVLPDADRFNVNFEQGSDVILQVNPRYSWLLPIKGYVVHNTRQNGKWGWEESKVDTPFPKGQMFALQILVTHESYKISTNGKLFSEYKHRMPFSSVERICVVGMVDLSLVAVHCIVPHLPPLPGTLMVPYKSIIYGGVQPGRCFVIQGQISLQANRVGFSLRHKTGIAFDYSLNFEDNKVVRNTYEDGKWGEEERSGPMPFEKGQTYLVTICCGPDNYEVLVNGKQAHTYSHRSSNLQEIDVLEVSGDVQLTFVQH
ncbi:galectin-9-like [Pseudorasbora parva]|uniref:galectin-9-like n=1 Tax=Pseudorasbora parva TaxID=51549 RepID=UPI00351EA235